VDLAACVALGFFLLYGLVRGFVLQLFSLAVLVATLVVADRFCASAGEFIRERVWSQFPPHAARAIGFLLIAVGGLTAGALVAHLFRGILSRAAFPFNRTLGGLFGLVKGGLVVMAVLLVLVNVAHEEDEPPGGVELDLLESRAADLTLWTVERLAGVLPGRLADPLRDYASVLRPEEE
jgi:membrane protein required for colicin V production